MKTSVDEQVARARQAGKLEGYKAAIAALLPMIDRMRTLRSALDEQLGDLLKDLDRWRVRHNATEPPETELTRERDQLERANEQLFEHGKKMFDELTKLRAEHQSLISALKTHSGDKDGYEFGLGRVRFEHGNPVSFIWAGQDEIDAAIAAAIKDAP